MHSIEFKKVEDTKDIAILEYIRTSDTEHDVYYAGKKIGYMYSLRSIYGMVIIRLTCKDAIENKAGGRDNYSFETYYNAKLLLSNLFYSL